MTAADQPTTEPSKDDLLDTRAGLALAHQAWSEGYAAHRRATQEQEDTGKWHTPSNPYFSALVLAPAPQPAAEQRCTACDGRGDEGSTYMNSGACQTCRGTGTQPAADTETEVQWGVRFPNGEERPHDDEDQARAIVGYWMDRAVEGGPVWTLIKQHVTRTSWEEA